MGEKKVMLPGHGDGWMEALYLPLALESEIGRVKARQNIDVVVYFREREKPTPTIEVNDAVLCEDDPNRYVVTKVELGKLIGASSTGWTMRLRASDVVEVYRAGCLIWSRGER